MGKRERLRLRIDSLRQPWDELLKHLAAIRQARNLATDVTEQLRLDAVLLSKQQQQRDLEAELDQLEAQLQALDSAPPTAPPAPALYWSYHPRDEPLRDELARLLSPELDARGLVSWHPRLVPPGQALATANQAALQQARAILLLISADYLADDTLVDGELAPTLARQRTGAALVVPIIARACLWQDSALAGLQVLPKDGLPIDAWPDRAMILRALAQTVLQALPR